MPASCDDYVHRVGRTGRMGARGVAYTFVTPEEGGERTRIEIRIDKLLSRRRDRRFRSHEQAAEHQPGKPPRIAVAGSTKQHHQRHRHGPAAGQSRRPAEAAAEEEVPSGVIAMSVGRFPAGEWK